MRRVLYTVRHERERYKKERERERDGRCVSHGQGRRVCAAAIHDTPRLSQ